MLIKFCNAFTKITAWPIQKIKFNTHIYYEDKNVQSRAIKGPALLISNHTSVFDYAVYLFVFWSRTLRVLMAELLFKKKVLGPYLKWMGGIRVNRNDYSFGFVVECEKILKQGGVVGIFPESRIPRPEEARPLPFKPSAAYIALSSGVPIIPVYTDGKYGKGEHASVIIGTPILLDEIEFSKDDSKADIQLLTQIMEQKIIYLGELLNEKKSV